MKIYDYVVTLKNTHRRPLDLLSLLLLGISVVYFILQQYELPKTDFPALYLFAVIIIIMIAANLYRLRKRGKHPSYSRVFFAAAIGWAFAAIAHRWLLALVPIFIAMAFFEKNAKKSL